VTEDAPAGRPIQEGSGSTRATRGQVLRDLLESDELLLMPAAFDALSARIVEAVGYQAIFVSGQAVANHLLGLPDYGYVGLHEMVTVCRWMSRATALPLFVDADTGYGSAVHVLRAVREVEDAGAAGLFIEDQEAPPRAGHVGGRRLIAMEEMVGKIRAAVDARRAPAFMVGARTAARSVEGAEAAIRRANAYAAAGADLAFVEGPLDEEEMRRFAQEVRVRYRLLNLGGAASQRTTPRPPLGEILAMGYLAAFFAANCSRAAMKGLWDYLSGVRERGTAADVAFIESLRGSSLENWYEFTGYPWLREQEERYLPAGETARRYAETLGTYYVPPPPDTNTRNGPAAGSAHVPAGGQDA
jgi:2-methylisocitrate lyase-like PEP mutase family enzyme